MKPCKCFIIGILCAVFWTPPITGECPLPRLMTLKPTDYKQSSWQTGEKITLECRPGYKKATPTTPLTSTCLKDGTWSPVTPCKKKLCKFPGDVLNGQIVFEQEDESLAYGASYHVECDSGFDMVGQKHITCSIDEQNGMVWSAPLPQCEIVKCIPPQVPDNVMFYPHMDVYTYRESISFSCKPQIPALTLIGNPSVFCTESGTWSGPLPECKLVKCPIPNIPHGTISPLQSRPYSYNQEVKVECTAPFILEGPEIITCLSDNQWHPYLPSCIPKPVPKPTDPHGHDMSPSNPPDKPVPPQGGDGKCTPCFCCNDYIKNKWIID
ncbi:BLLF1-like major outer envelope glycoprotein [Marmot herpesvirus 1]|nr:BLLF1-like major outer envelope glycoprotein [Marmot herpesvirus 1]WIM51714.1 MAG: hypothetical protein ADFBMEEK_00080 [Peromyscus leucopus gammaherpesvirus]